MTVKNHIITIPTLITEVDYGLQFWTVDNNVHNHIWKFKCLIMRYWIINFKSNEFNDILPYMSFIKKGVFDDTALCNYTIYICQIMNIVKLQWI